MIRKPGAAAIFTAVLLGSSSVASAVTIDVTDFGAASGLNLVSDASVQGSALRLSSSNYSRVGAAWFSNLVNVADGFTVTFRFQITDRHQLLDNGTVLSGADVASGGDGIAFVVQNASVNAIGLPNSGIGYYGIQNSLAVEFDTWKNQKPSYCEPDNNHIAVQSLGTAANRPEHCASNDPNDSYANPTLGIYSPSADFASGAIYQARIDYRAGSLRVFFVDMSNPVMNLNVDLRSLLALDNGNGAFIGFTSSTGGAWENHDLVNFSFTNDVPEGNMIGLLGMALGLVVVKRTRRVS